MSTALPMDRRSLIKALAGAAVAIPFVDLTSTAQAADGLTKPVRTTLEAYADTIVPGDKRYAGDVAIAGAAPGPGAVQAGALTLMTMPALGIARHLPGTAESLDREAAGSFVRLPYEQRAALVERLTDTTRPDRLVWVGFAVLSSLAFDFAPHLHTADAVRAGHPGLAFQGFPQPEADGRWRKENHSYGRPLANLHPATTEKGHPA